MYCIKYIKNNKHVNSLPGVPLYSSDPSEMKSRNVFNLNEIRDSTSVTVSALRLNTIYAIKLYSFIDDTYNIPLSFWKNMPSYFNIKLYD